MTGSTVAPLVQPGKFSDLLTDVLRGGAQRLLAPAVEAEEAAFIDVLADRRLADGRANGAPRPSAKRDIQTGMEDESQCMLMITGATPEGKKELVRFLSGDRESA